MKYIIYFSLMLLVFSSCRTSGFTKQRYTHYAVSHHKPDGGHPSGQLTKPVVGNRATASVETPDFRSITSQSVTTASAQDNTPLLASADKRSALPLLTKKVVKAVGFGKPDVKPVKQQASDDGHRGPIGALLDLIFTIVLIVVLVFVVILLILLL